MKVVTKDSGDNKDIYNLWVGLLLASKLLHQLDWNIHAELNSQSRLRLDSRRKKMDAKDG